MPHIQPAAHRGGGHARIPGAVEAFVSLAELWELSTDQQLKLLGSPARSTFFKWKKEGGAIPRDVDERVSHLLAIYKALQILLPRTDSADAWIKEPNNYFKNESALNVMLGGNVVDIYRVRQYLDAQRGG